MVNMFTSMKFSVFAKDANRMVAEWERDMDSIYKTFGDLAKAIQDKIEHSGEITFARITTNTTEISNSENFPVEDANYDFTCDGHQYRIQVTKCTKCHKVD